MIGAVVLAGGQGKRMNAGINKQYLRLDGRTVLSYAIQSLAARADELIITIAKGEKALCEEAIGESGVKRSRIQLVEGGKERQDSVRHALEAMPSHWEKVLIHDGARPFVPVAVLDRLLVATEPGIGVIPGLAVSDTIKQVDEEGFVVATPPRALLRAAHTPQCFMAAEILSYHQQASASDVIFTDDAALFEYFDARVRVVEGDAVSKKLTVQDDLLAALELKKRWEAQQV